jgi:hypothetical protein
MIRLKFNSEMKWQLLATFSIAFLLGIFVSRAMTISVNETDIKYLNDEITRAEQNLTLYQGGIIKDLINLRVQLLKAQKENLTHGWMNFFGFIPTRLEGGISLYVCPEFDPTLIMQDIKIAEKELSDAREEYDKYVGGLIKLTILSRIETSELILASLKSKELSLRYCIPNLSVGLEKYKPRPVANPQTDKEAL